MNVADTAPTRPVLRYHGGKFRLAPWVVSWLPAHRVYLEPYLGAGSVFMHKPRCHVEVLNDLSDRIVNLFQVLRDPHQAQELERLLRLTPYARAEYEAAIVPTDAPVEAARRLVTLAYMGFGAASLNTKHLSGFRVKWSGSYVSGSNSWLRYPDAIAAFTERLQGVTIERKPALRLIEQYDKENVLIYADPPYVGTERNMSHPSCRYQYDMTEQDHRDLAAVLRASKSMVVLSGYPSLLYDELFPDWKMVTCQARIEHGQIRTEALWLNPACVAALEREQKQGALELTDEDEEEDLL